MATGKETSDIAKLQRDVAVMQNDLKYISKGNDEIKAKIDKMNFVSVGDYDRDQTEVNKRIKALEDYNSENKVGATVANLLGNKGLALLVAALLAAIAYMATKGGGL